jgi:tetraacyldisaccharide 4'-kinase
MRYNGGRSIPCSQWQGITAVAFAGLGNPEPFFRALASRGIRLLRTEYYTDHYEYTRRDWRTLSAMFERTGADILVTTEKDAVRLDGSLIGDFPLYTLESYWRIEEDSEAFFSLIRSVFPVTL